ncbi:MAG: hemolysin family protein [Fluviicola sp.]|nr:hemolysin family protein [Fluviicola sp.]
MESELIIIIATLVFSAFFSGMEIAFIASNRLKVEMDRTKGTLNGRILGVFYKNESHFIATLLLGNNVSLVVFGISAAALLNPIIESWGITSEGVILIIQTTLSTLLVLSTAEFLPKALVQINPNGYLKFTSIIMISLYWILYLPTQLIVFLSNGFLKLVKSEGDDNSQKVFSKVDLEHYVQDINERIKEEQEFGNEMQILQNALDFSNLKTRDCMVPRMEIVAIEVEEEIEDLQQLFINKGLSKILVYRDSVDNIIGYVHSFEMFKKPQSIKQILLPISFVPEVMPAKELMELFSKQSGNIAVVVDEYGGTSGVITLEDVIEEIFGDIVDEHDKEDLLEQKISDSEFIFSARLDIDYINEAYNLSLPDSDEYETLGGLIINTTESIPDSGDEVTLEKYTLIIDQVSDRKIEVVKVIVL